MVLDLTLQQHQGLNLSTAVLLITVVRMPLQPELKETLLQTLLVPLKEELDLDWKLTLTGILSASEETPLQTLQVRILPLKEAQALDLMKLTLMSLPTSVSVFPEETLLILLQLPILLTVVRQTPLQLVPVKLVIGTLVT